MRGNDVIGDDFVFVDDEINSRNGQAKHQQRQYDRFAINRLAVNRVFIGCKEHQQNGDIEEKQNIHRVQQCRNAVADRADLASLKQREISRYAPEK